MLSTSVAYQTAVVQSTRSTDALISFEVLDIGAKAAVTATSTSTASFSSADDMVDDIYDEPIQIATFEKDYFKLNGLFYLVPDDVAANDIRSWWSSTLSTALSALAVPIDLLFDFPSIRSSVGIRLTFDKVGGTCFKDFVVNWYNGLTLLDTVTVTGNSLLELNVENQVENYDSIKITVSSLNKPSQRAKLNEIDFGLVEQFTNDILIRANVVEEVDPVSTMLSVNTLKFTLLNTDQRFNMINPDGVIAYLQQRQKLIAKSALLLPSGLFEYVDLGTFYLSDWKNSNGVTASLEATDLFGVLDKTIFYSSAFYSGASISSVLTAILSDAGITEPLTVDASASSSTVSGFIPILSHREAFQYVLLACSCTARMNRDGSVFVFKPSYSPSLVEVDNGVIVGGDPKIEQLPLISSVETNEFTFVLNGSAEVVYSTTLSFTGQIDLVLPFTKTPIDVATVSLTITGATVQASQYSATTALLSITGSGAITISISAKTYAITSKKIYSSLPAVGSGDVPQVATIADNYLIVGNGAAVTLAMLNYYQKRIKQTFQYWCNPALQSGDCIDVETMFAGIKSGVIEAQDIQFSPTLTARIEVVG